MEQKRALHIMVDLETASKKENAAILSWAMVPFFTDGNEVEDVSSFYGLVNLTSCFLCGMDIEKDTQQWWVDQNPIVKHQLTQGLSCHIHDVANEAFAYLEAFSSKYDIHLWSRGLDFDIPKIEWCFNRFVERPLPYKYSHKMDVRSILKFANVDQSQFEFEGVKHNSLDDCKHDIKMIQYAYARMNELKEYINNIE